VTQGVNTVLGLIYVMLVLAIVIALMGITNTLSLALWDDRTMIGCEQPSAQAVGCDVWMRWWRGTPADAMIRVRQGRPPYYGSLNDWS
jgi:hypothetical protein